MHTEPQLCCLKSPGKLPEVCGLHRNKIPYPSYVAEFLFVIDARTSVVAQWLRIRLPMQIEPFLDQGSVPLAAEQLSPCATTTEAHAPRACAPQQEKPQQ